MPMTRHPARSFTFEIKRASRRRPEVVTVSKTLSHASPLADEVFGASSERPRDQETPQAKRTFLPISGQSDVLPDNTAPSPRRVLPDLLSIQVDPVAERMQCLAHERATRREASRAVREQVLAPGPVHEEQVVTERTAVFTSGAIAQEHETANLAGETLTRRRSLRQRDKRALRRRAIQAEREGQPAPRLPAGQRWKRRLPPICW